MGVREIFPRDGVSANPKAPGEEEAVGQAVGKEVLLRDFNLGYLHGKIRELDVDGEYLLRVANSDRPTLTLDCEDLEYLAILE